MLDMCSKILENAEQLTFLFFKSIDNIKRCDCLMLSMLSVCYCITDNALKKDLENISDLIVDHSRNMLDIIIVHKTMNSKLNNAHDVVL